MGSGSESRRGRKEDVEWWAPLYLHKPFDVDESTPPHPPWPLPPRPLGSGTGCRRGTHNQTQWGDWESGRHMRSGGSWWFLSMIECTVPQDGGYIILILGFNELSLVTVCAKVIVNYSNSFISRAFMAIWDNSGFIFLFAVLGRSQSHCFILPQWHTDTQTHTWPWCSETLRGAC